MEQNELLARCARLPVAIISDVLRNAGHPHQILHHRIARIWSGPTLVGPAYCVRGERVLGGSTPKNLRFAMYKNIPTGSVLVMASGGYQDAVVIGENVAIALKVRGCQGVITDGGVRDRDSMNEVGMPIYAQFVSPLSSGRQWVTTAIDEPVVLPGQTDSVVHIHPGDIVVADGDGVAIIPLRGFQTVVEDSEVILEIESATREDLLKGADPELVYESRKRFEHVRRF